MARRTHTVFVGNLPFDVTEGEVAEMFSEAGPVRDMRIVTDKETGRPKGFGFCEFYDIDASETAVSRIDGQRMNGRVLRVYYADDMPSKGGGRDRDGPRGSKGSGGAATEAMASMMASGGSAQGGGREEDSFRGILDDAEPAALFQVASQMAALVRSNPASARQVLIAQPQLTHAILKAQMLLGMVQLPAEGAAANGAPAAPAAALHPLPQHPPQPPSVAPLSTAIPGTTLPGLAPLPPPGYAPPPALVASVPPLAPLPAAPLPVVPPPAAPPPAARPAAAASAAAALSATQQQALIQRLLSLTPEQLEGLPPVERAQAKQIISVMKAQQSARAHA